MIPFNLDQILDYVATLDVSVRQSVCDYLTHTAEADALPSAVEYEKFSGQTPNVAHDYLFAVLDQRHIHERPAIKWYNPFTHLGDRTGKSRLTKKKGFCFHHTGVYQGFGPYQNVVDKYLDLIRAPELEGLPQPLEALQALTAGSDGMAQLVQLNRDMHADAWARMMAVGGRLRGEGRPGQYNNGVSYQIVRCANSVLVLNLDFEWVPWASNGANTDFISWAWDANGRKEVVEDAEDLIADVGYSIELAREEGHPIREFTVHGAWTNKPDDPSAEFIRKVLEPAADRYGCIIDYDFKSARSHRSISEMLAG